MWPGLSWGNTPVTGGFPSQRASNEESFSMAWRHHVSSHPRPQVVKLTWITALNQHVLPTFFNPTGQPSFRFRSWGFNGSTNQRSPLFRLVPAFSARLASSALEINFWKTLQCCDFLKLRQSRSLFMNAPNTILYLSPSSNCNYSRVLL